MTKGIGREQAEPENGLRRGRFLIFKAKGPAGVFPGTAENILFKAKVPARVFQGTTENIAARDERIKLRIRTVFKQLVERREANVLAGGAQRSDSFEFVKFRIENSMIFRGNCNRRLCALIRDVIKELSEEKKNGEECAAGLSSQLQDLSMNDASSTPDADSLPFSFQHLSMKS